MLQPFQVTSVTSCKILSFFIVGCIEKLVYSVVQLEGYLYIGG